MLFRSPIHQTHAVAKGGAILEGDEGELRVPAQVNLDATLGGALFTTRSFPVGTRQEQTFIVDAGFIQDGVTATADTTVAELAPGAWDFLLQWSMDFTGTANNTSVTRLMIDTDVGGFTNPRTLAAYELTATGIHREYHTKFSLDLAHATRIVYRGPATVAGDALHSRISLLAQRLF